jgi:hypothetical protein
VNPTNSIGKPRYSPTRRLCRFELLSDPSPFLHLLTHLGMFVTLMSCLCTSRHLPFDASQSRSRVPLVASSRVFRFDLIIIAAVKPNNYTHGSIFVATKVSALFQPCVPARNLPYRNIRPEGRAARPLYHYNHLMRFQLHVIGRKGMEHSIIGYEVAARWLLTDLPS